MIEVARLRDGSMPALEWLEDLGRSRRKSDLAATTALVFEEFARTGTLEITRELNSLRRSNMWEIKAGKVRLPFYWISLPFDSRAIRLTHGFLKGTDRTPRAEIDKADWIRREDLQT